MKRVLLILLAIGMHYCMGAVRWTGGAGNERWDDAGNWEGAVLPAVNDDVILDNNLFFGSYIVRLPDISVLVRSISIVPSAGQEITVLLPAENMLSSAAGSSLPRAFEISGAGYSMLIGAGGTFINGSGSNSGYAIRLGDSLQILNAGRYIHRTRSSHAELVEKLSRMPTAAFGIFRFENTDAASVISLSGRVFGQLEFSAAHAPSQQLAYTAAGTNNASIRGDLILDAGVSLTLNFSDSFHIAGGLLVNNAGLNMASANRSVVFNIAGSFRKIGGLIHASNSNNATGEILLAGRSVQMIDCDGRIGPGVKLVLDNADGFQSMRDLQVYYQLELRRGRLKMNAMDLLSLGTEARIVSDSLQPEVYVEGKIRKESWTGQPFRFPVGSNGKQRWILLSGGTGDVSVSYEKTSPRHLAETVQPSLDHISGVEYWVVDNNSSTNIKAALSFDNGFSGGISDLSTLRVAALHNGYWWNAGNESVTGTIEAGSVTSDLIAMLPLQYLTLSSTSAHSNILPIFIVGQHMNKTSERWFCDFTLGEIEDGDSCYLEWSQRGDSYQKMASVILTPEKNDYRKMLPAAFSFGFCRIVLVDQQQRKIYGKPMKFGAQIYQAGITISRAMVDQGLEVFSDRNRLVWIRWFDGKGSLVHQINYPLQKGKNAINSHHGHLPAGIYAVNISDPFGIQDTKKLFLQ